MAPTSKTAVLLPQPQSGGTDTARARRPTRTRDRACWLVGCALAWLLYSAWRWSKTPSEPTPAQFYANVSRPTTDICPATDGPGNSYSGYIGLRGDTPDTPKRIFFWYFEAEHDAENAPTIMTIGGGPGTSGLINPMSAQGPCLAAENGSIPNPNRWTEHFNLIALDHPVGVGFSYGTQVNNSRSAAIDAYDFLQKFYLLFPHLVGNQFILSGGSYGGMYVPHIATVIHLQNAALALGKGPPGAVHINLESMMVSNPISDALSHFSWLLQMRCYTAPGMYNASTCAELFAVLPACLDAIRFAQEQPLEEATYARRVEAQRVCRALEMGDRHGTVTEDVRRKCYSKEPLGCLPPSFGWTTAFFQRGEVKAALGIPEHVNYTALAQDVTAEFMKYGDIIQPAYLLYEPLLAAGIRLLHYVGAQDANCAWPGVLSFLKLIESPFQHDFRLAPDVPWPSSSSSKEEPEATVRAVGQGAGNMTYILVQGGGHFVARDQPKLVKSIVEKWVWNAGFV